MLQVRAGDVEKLRMLFDRHQLALFNFFLRLTGNRESSEDLVQEVFFRILKYRQTYRGTSQFSFWMFQIARNARIDYFKKQKREVKREQELDDLADEDPLALESLQGQQNYLLLRSALQRLSTEEREVLILSRFQNLKYKEIAHLVGCAEGTVKARVHHAIKNLRDIFFELSGEKPK